MRQEEADLVRKCQQGDLQAFEDIYRRHSTTVYNLALRMVQNRSDAEDLLQEIFLLAYSKLAGFQGHAALSTWLYRLAVNRCLDHLRSRARRNQSVTDSLEETWRGPSLASTPEAGIDLERAISRLPRSYRAAFLLHDVEGLEHRQVGQILGVAEGTSKSLVHKARAKLRGFLGDPGTGARS
ncbi:MAG: RNA polymerase sigma factor [Acidobacteriota bacterium]